MERLIIFTLIVILFRIAYIIASCKRTAKDNPIITEYRSHLYDGFYMEVEGKRKGERADIKKLIFYDKSGSIDGIMVGALSYDSDIGVGSIVWDKDVYPALPEDIFHYHVAEFILHAIEESFGGELYISPPEGFNMIYKKHVDNAGYITYIKPKGFIVKKI